MRETSLHETAGVKFPNKNKHITSAAGNKTFQHDGTRKVIVLFCVLCLDTNIALCPEKRPNSLYCIFDMISSILAYDLCKVLLT